MIFGSLHQPHAIDQIVGYRLFEEYIIPGLQGCQCRWRVHLIHGAVKQGIRHFSSRDQIVP